MSSRILVVVIAFVAAGCRSGADLAEDVVALPGGTQKIGTSAEELTKLRSLYPDLSARLLEADLPERSVALVPFAIDRYKVTNESFARFASVANVSEIRARHPVVNVTWQAADAYCRRRGGRLPTEAEWEYAARGGRERRIFPWGDEPADPSRANYGASGFKTTTAVGSYPPNGYGLFDMSGNVWEWTATPMTPGRYVIRGGSWGGAPVNLRVAYRDSHRADDPREFVGFRCVYGL